MQSYFSSSYLWYFISHLSVDASFVLRCISVSPSLLLHIIFIEYPLDIHRISTKTVDIRWTFGGHSSKLYRRIKGVSTENWQRFDGHKIWMQLRNSILPSNDFLCCRVFRRYYPDSFVGNKNVKIPYGKMLNLFGMLKRTQP